MFSEDFRADSFMRNKLIGLGNKKKDVEMHNRPLLRVGQTLDVAELEGLYSTDAIAQKVVNRIPEMAVSGGIDLKVSGKSIESDLMREIRHSGIIKSMGAASKLARLYYRGAAVILDIDDGQPPNAWHQPVNRRNIKSVRVAYVADGIRVFPFVQSLIDLEPEYYQVALGAVGSEEIAPYQKNLAESLGNARFHRDRVLWLDGVWTPPNIKLQLQGSISQLGLFWGHYSRYEAAKAHVSNMLHRDQVLNIKRKGLSSILIGSTAAEETSLRQEAETIADRMLSLGVALSDSDNTEFDIISRKFDHLKSVIDEFKYAAVAASGGLTELSLFGLSTQTSGLAKDDLRDRSLEAQNVNQYQEDIWREPLEKFLELFFLAKEGPTKGNPPKNWELEFPSSLHLTEVEKAELRSKQAATDKTYVIDMKIPHAIAAKTSLPGRWSILSELPEDFEAAPDTAPPVPQGREEEVEQ